MTNKIKHAVLTLATIAVTALTVTAEAQPVVDINSLGSVMNLNHDERLQDCSSGYGETFECTFYGGGGVTALGNPVYEGCIAVDPSVIPLGSTVYVEFPAGYEYLNGSYYCCDTGGAIYGNIIDVYVDAPDHELDSLGRITVTVYR